MDATTIFITAIAITAVLAAAAVFTVAFRRGADSRPITAPSTGVLDKRAIKRDLAARQERVAEGEQRGGVATLVKEEAEAAEEEVEVEAEAEPSTEDPILRREELTEEEFGVTRRQFFNRAILGLFGGAFMGGLTISFLAFLWPKLSGGFGSPIAVGMVGDLRNEIQNADGTFTPVFVAAAQSWIVPWTREAGTEGTSFEGIPVIAGAEGGERGLMALWQKCVHLGCRVPSCESSQGFECPCHGSKYNLHGEYEDGPAPRNLDHFGVEVNDRGELVVNTGDVYETARARVKTVDYPQGPNCL